MRAPIILIVGRISQEAKNVRGAAYASGQRYSNAIERAGGIPLMLPPIPALLDGRLPDLLKRVDGTLFHGGGDVDPRHYGQDASAKELYGIVAEHDTVEIAVMRAAIELDLPVLGLCRGLQVLNVVCGGTLRQDIGTETHWLQHLPVELDPGSRLAKAFGSHAPRNCHHVHHQSIDRLGEGLRVVGRSDDGMLEAVELDRARWVVATQWHPEDDAADDSEQQNVFDELVRQSRP
ncbi:MAG: gamma-glutamyl-gamma-aminobutyrate hydrolase family protein [Ilumatobacteraceae bacterium]